MKPLTERQQQVYDVVKEHIESTGMPPTRAEIANQLGFKSANAAEEHLKALAKKGAIEIIPSSSRGIRLLLENDENRGIPLVGKVAAGTPIAAIEHVESYHMIDPTLFYPNADYLLKVDGMSMKNIGIFDGDYLVVHKTNQVKQGDVIVARIGEEVTVKRFKQNNNCVELIAENEEFQTIVIDLAQHDFVIEGLAVGVIKQNNW